MNVSQNLSWIWRSDIPEVWLDVNILVCGSLDELCWNAISWGLKPAMVFYHPSYGTEALGGNDFVESWCLATKPQNPFFISWRDTFKAGTMSINELQESKQQSEEISFSEK